MNAADKVAVYYRFAAEERPDRDLFDQIIHDDIQVSDPPIGAGLVGKVAAWEALNVSPELKQGPGTMNLKSWYVGYFGDENEGYGRWNWCMGGAVAPWYGLPLADDPPEDNPILVEVIAHIKFKDGKIIEVCEAWDAVPVLRRFGLDLPVPKPPVS